MKTLKLITLLALVSLVFSSCSDNGPTSLNERDADILRSTSESIMSSATTAFTVQLNPSHVGTQNSGFQKGYCPTPPAGQEDWYGWHFVMPGNNVFTSLSVTFQNAGTFSADPFPGTVFVAHPSDKHAYIWTPTDDVLLSGVATSSGDARQFNLSHVCPAGYEPSLEVSKTVDTEYTRTHEWSIDKRVETNEGLTLNGYPKIWLYTDGSGNEKATWTVDVDYVDYEDSDFNISGTITIKNISSSTKSITSIDDVLAGSPIDVECGVVLPYSLPAGETLECTYDEDVLSKVEGDNVVTVTVDGEDDPYSATEPIFWGDPTTEYNATVNIKDISDLFGDVELGTVTEPNGYSFTYKKYFKWSDYGADKCGSFTYDNTATIVETEQDADATLKVNVQCFVYDSVWAKGDKPIAAGQVEAFCDNGFNNWGWTNNIVPGSYEWDLWAGAGQCDISKGTLVGTIVVSYNGGFNYEFKFNAGLDFKDLKVYAGKDMFPKLNNGRSTTAPGQYSIANNLSGDIWVIAHGVVGHPDPNFGPN